MYDDEIPVGKAKDLTNKQFGKLTVLYRTKAPNDSTKHAYWRCKCDCGKIIVVSSTNLQSGHTNSCGCLKHKTPSNFIDLTGKKFNRLTVLYQNGTKNHEALWHCKCDCGNECDAVGSKITSGHVQSCGCLIKEKASQIHTKDMTGQKIGRLTVLYQNSIRKHGEIVWHCKCDCGNECDVLGSYLRDGTTSSCGCYKKENSSKIHLIDLTGQRFGKLTVLYRDFTSEKGTKWHCKCDCGNECIVFGDNLKRGHTQSCGCETSSFGEKYIKNLLNQFNIEYATEQTFKTCYFPDTKQYARFDFYINQKYLLEFDGIQHFIATGGWSTEEHLEQTKKHDEFKNQWCKDNNIPLIRIPYTKLNTLCIEDLLLETTQFRVI